MTESATTPWQASVVTLFPEMFPGPLGYSIIGRALENKIWDLETIALREFAHDKHQSVDDTPCGGGPGMIMRPEVVDEALHAACQDDVKERIILNVSPRGMPLQQKRVKQLANAKKVVILCGRFEGIDQRVLEEWGIEEVCLGDFILAGGEVAAMTLIEACVRLLPGVLGTSESLEEESFSQGLLEYPQYTRPRNWKDREVPEVLFSGHHSRIKQWQHEQSEKVTQERRPDLWKRYVSLNQD